MASPTLVLVAKKMAVQLATDKRTWTVVASIVVGLILVLMLPILILFSSQSALNTQTLVIELCFNDEDIPEEIGITNTMFIEGMRVDFGEIDIVVENLEDENIDIDFIKSVYYGLKDDQKIVITEEFYTDFVMTFFNEEGAYIDEKEEIYSLLEGLISNEITFENKKDIDMVYNFIKYGTIPVGMSDFSGVPPEALKDETFRQLMTEATKYIGFPYVWGGSTPQTSFDCSGYICWVYTQSGVYNLPRTTAQQIYNQTVPIPRSQAKAGDLVFFTKTYKTDEAVTHVGIYMGDGRMLHCGNPIGYVSIDNPYWSSHYYGFGRLQTLSTFTE